MPPKKTHTRCGEIASLQVISCEDFIEESYTITKTLSLEEAKDFHIVLIVKWKMKVLINEKKIYLKKSH